MSQYVAGPKSLVSGETLTQYALVKLNTSRQAVYADANDVPFGYTLEEVNTSGDRVAVQPLTKDGTFPAISAGTIPVGSKVYTAADGKVSATRGGALVGRFVGDASASSGDIIEVAAIPNAELTYASVAATAEVENTTTETSFGDTYSIPANSLQAGSVIEVISHGFVVDNNSTDTLLVKAYIGSSVIVATAAIDVADNDRWLLHAFITCRTIGASGTFVAGGIAGLGVVTTGTARVSGLASATIDTTAAIVIDVKGTWSVTHADNEARQEQLIVIVHG